jgi:hypothetical protein
MLARPEDEQREPLLPRQYGHLRNAMATRLPPEVTSRLPRASPARSSPGAPPLGPGLFFSTLANRHAACCPARALQHHENVAPRRIPSLTAGLLCPGPFVGYRDFFARFEGGVPTGHHSQPHCSHYGTLLPPAWSAAHAPRPAPASGSARLGKSLFGDYP